MAGNDAMKKKTKGQPIGEPFAPLLDRLMYGDAFRALSTRPRCILTFMIAEAPRPYEGQTIVMSARYAGDHSGCHWTTAWKAMQKIDNSGLATIVDLGRLGPDGEGNRATRWRLDFWSPPSKNATRAM
jgi:hypothetical protein